MASGWRLQVGLATGLGLLATTTACEPASSTQASPQTVSTDVDAPETSLVVLAAATVTVPIAQIVDCVDLVQFGAYVGDADLTAMWDAAAHDVGRLRENCASLGRGDPAALAAMSDRRRSVDAYLGAGTAPAGGNGATTTLAESSRR